MLGYRRMLLLGVLLTGASAAPALEPGELLIRGSVGFDSGVLQLEPFGGPAELLLPRPYSSYALDADGTLVAEIVGDVVRVDLATGAETPISSGGPLHTAADIALFDGFAYGVDDSTPIEGVVRVNLATGEQTLVASKGNLIDPKGVAVDGDGLLYVADPAQFDPGLIVRVDPDAFDDQDLAANQTVIASGLGNPWAAAFAANGDLMVGDNFFVRRFTRNPDDSWTEAGAVSLMVPITIRDLEIDDGGDVIAVGFGGLDSRPGVFRVRPDGSAPFLSRTIFGPFEVEVAPGLPQRRFASERIATGLEQPTYATAPPGDPRVFILEQAGRIRIWKDGALLNDPFLDLSAVTEYDPLSVIGDERGLLGLAFAPDYAESGVFYVMYVATDLGDASGPGRITIARFTVSANPDVANPAGELLVSIPKPDRPADFEAYHNGGQLAFGPDGLLYAGVGDGGTPVDPHECAQNPSSPLGKILRLDPAQIPQGGIVLALSAQCPVLPQVSTGLEIWATGLRQPYRHFFDWQSDDLYIADVGENLFEEVNVVAAGDLAGAGPNFGWDRREGTFCNSNDPAPGPCPDAALTDPVYTYVHREPPSGGFCGGSVIGGPVYRGSIPELRGHYFFADFCQRFVQSLLWDGGSGIVGAPAERTFQFEPDAGSIGSISALGEDGEGELLIVDYGSGFAADGEVFRVIPVPEPGDVASLCALLVGVAALATRRVALGRRMGTRPSLTRSGTSPSARRRRS